ncbi:MAG: hypothetical protein ABJK20_05975 [Halieaceae bacterium]
MSNHVSFSYTNESSASGPAQNATLLFCVHPFEVMPLNEKTSLLVSRLTGKSFPVAVHLIPILQQIDAFRTLVSHHNRMPGHIQEILGLQALKELILALIQSGIATSSADLISGFKEAPELPASEPASNRIFLLTCDREEELERLLTSIFLNADLSLHEGLYLLDDSRNPEIAARNKALLIKYQSTCPVPIHYFGEVEKKEFMQRLIDAEPESELAVRQLLDRSQWQGRKTYGLSRNWALVLSAGHRCIMVDDDVLCEAFYPALTEDKIRFCNTINVQVMASESEWRKQVIPAGFDPLKGHLTLLGRTVGDCLPIHSSTGSLTNEALEGMNCSQLMSLSQQSPIIVSECGTYGDPGFPSHAFLLKNPPKNIEDILTSDPDLSLTFGQRQFQAVQRSLSIYDLAGISQMTGVDNTRLLPPYFPAFRGEDGLFGWMVKQMYPESRAVIYNWGIPHQPLENRESSYLEEDFFPKIGLGDFQSLCTDRTNLTGKSTPVGRLKLLSAMIRDLSEKPQEELVALARIEAVRKPATVYLDASTRLPYFSDQSVNFANYLQTAIKKASEYLQSPPPLSDWFEIPGDRSDSEVVSRTASAAKTFAEALESWPDVWRAAKKIN